MSEAKELVAGSTSEIVKEIPVACSDELAAVEFFERQRWQGEPYCPHCGTVGAVMMRDRETGKRSKRFLWRCTNGCKRQFTVKVGTVMEDSRIAYRHWAYAFWAACASKKGVSALQIKRQTGINYRSALFLLHRIRFAMSDSPGTTPPLTGTVEVDETYVGGKPRNYPSSYKGPRRKKGFKGDKECVVAMVERGGEIRPAHVKRAGGSVQATVLRNVSRDARLMTDESNLYAGIGKQYAGHEAVMHSLGEYARVGRNSVVAHTNTAEGFFSLLKRGLHGVYHSVSPKHLHRYLSEFQFRHNLRHVEDGERTVAAIRKADGKRLTYKVQVEG